MLPIYSRSRFSLLHIFFFLFVAECCLGGSGALITYGALTIRKVDFVIALTICFVIIAHNKKVERDVFYITVSFAVLLIFSFTLGIINYGLKSDAVENILMQSFFLVLPFYTFFIFSFPGVKQMIALLKFSSLFMAIAYLCLLSLIFLKIIPLATTYNFLTQNPDVFGRGALGFWYKGFIYMCVGIYFWQLEKRKWLRYLSQIVLLTAIFFTFTRGFFVAIFFTGVLYYLFFGNVVRSALILIIGVVCVIYLSNFYTEISFNRQESDYVRVMQLQQVKERITPSSFFIGHGFGYGVPIRENHMEINYLEIFHKQGIIGLLFWICLLAYLIVEYINIRKNNKDIEKYAKPFLLATTFVYFQSLTNPFLTNSIGMNVIMLTIASFSVLKKLSVESFSSDGNI